MIAQCWLHIGIEKTGTTSIQEFLARNRDALLKRGLLYPVTPGRSNHIGLTCYALDDEKRESLRRILGITTKAELDRYRSRLLADIENEIDFSTATSLIFSNEHLSSRLRTAAEIRRLKLFCSRIAARTTVVVYLRNQVDFLVSRYIEAVKGGNTNSFSFRPKSAITGQIDYARMLRPWRDIFGPDKLVVRRFEQTDFVGGDLLLDFADMCGIESGGLHSVPRRNVAPDAQCIEFLREFNKYVPQLLAGRRNPLRGEIVNALESAGSGEPFLISRELTSVIEEQFEASNKAVSVEYFGGRYDPLFSRPTKIATTVPAVARSIGVPESIRIAAHLWQAQQTGLNAIVRRGSSNRTQLPGPAPVIDRQKKGCKPALRRGADAAAWLKSKALRLCGRFRVKLWI